MVTWYKSLRPCVSTPDGPCSSSLTSDFELRTPDSSSPLRHHLGFSQRGSMRQRQVETVDTEQSSVLLSFAVQHDLRARTAWPHDFDVEPTDVAPPATAQGFHRRFLGREARRIALIFAHASAFTVFLLSSRKYPIAKADSRVRLFHGGADALDLSQVIANGNNHFRAPYSAIEQLSTLRNCDR